MAKITGYVLKPTRSAPSNATTTGPSDSAVPREHTDLPGGYVVPGTFVDVAGDQYRSAILHSPRGGVTEYLLWAANSSNLSVLEDISWTISEGSGAIPTGTLSVGTFTDGTSHVIVTDNDARSIAQVLSLTVKRGDLPLAPITFTSGDFASQDADGSLVVLDGAALLALDGGLSLDRGDTITEVTYYLAAQRFWWTRNDPDLQRFGWNGLLQRWEPYKGGAVVNLGMVLEGSTFTLLPRPSRFSPGDYLPGDPLLPDSYSMVRVGDKPDATTSTPVVVLVVSDEEAAATYSFPPTVDAVVGTTSGVLQWNPTYVLANAGVVAWFSPEDFDPLSNGVLGPLKGATDSTPLFLAPIPGPTDRPFIRLGNRRPLTPIMAETDADLSSLTVLEGEVGWSLSTGKLKFSTLDLVKADPEDVGFELAYLGAKVIFAGVSLTTQPLSTRAPVQVVDAAGTPTTVGPGNDLYVPLAAPLPTPGVSGVSWVPDDTGTVPNASTTPSTRPNGSGLVRTLALSGDVFLFGRPKAISTTEIVEFEEDIPSLAFKIPSGTAFIAKQDHGLGLSKIGLGLKDRRALAGEPLYFVQAEVVPSVYVSQAQLISRLRGPFACLGTEVLAFAVDGTSYLWDASSLGAGTFTADVVAASIDAVITGTGSCTSRSGTIIISSGNLSTGSVEIGYGSIVSGAYADRDLSGCALLGFNPGWLVSNPGSTDNWISDSGTSIGVRRSPQNLDRANAKPDMKARARFKDVVIQRNVNGSPALTVNNPPLEDVAGYDENVFFQTQDGAYRQSLHQFREVVYRFEDSLLYWADEGSISASVTSPTNSLTLGTSSVVPETLYPSVGNGYGLYVAPTGGARQLLTLDEDYAVAPGGTALLSTSVGTEVTSGARGTFTGGSTTFTDAIATFVTDGVSPGYRLKLTSGPVSARGSYIVDSVTSETELEVSADVVFPESGGPVTWAINEGVPTSSYDPGIVADAIYEDFNHLPDEPFEIRLLSFIGDVGTTLVAVASDALAEHRMFSVRFGLPYGSPEAIPTPLTTRELGVVANQTLAVPDNLDSHFVEGAFAIVVGDKTYAGGDLVAVNSFTVPLAGDTIEYGDVGSPIEGQLNFGTTTLAERAESLVYYVQTFRAPVDLIAGEAEIDPNTGEISLSQDDLTDFVGLPAYFVEQVVTEQRQDVVISPLQGTIFFNRPLRAFQLVEVSYYTANVYGEKSDGILHTEQLPLYVRQEAATYVSDRSWAINPTGRTIDPNIGFQVWVDNRLQNYGNLPTASLNATTNTIDFNFNVPSGATVLVNYTVLEAFGGEQAYVVAAPPVYRPPFRIPKNATTFTLDTDRTGDVVPGKVLRLGAFPLYIQASTYDAGTDTTTVTIFPAPPVQVGSSAPGNDVLTVLTDEPVVDDVNGTATPGPAGFMRAIVSGFEPVDKGMLSINFFGDLRPFIVAGHLLEIGGFPHIVAGVASSEDGSVTRVSLTTPLEKTFTFGVDAVKVSARPIYPPSPLVFTGVGPGVAGSPVEVVRFGSKDIFGNTLPGRTLIEGVEYVFIPSSGSVSLVDLYEEPLQAGEWLQIFFLKARIIGPRKVDGTVIVPTYGARYVYITSPSEVNGYLGATVLGTYTFASPDSFYVRALPFADFMGEVNDLAVSRVAAQNPHGGPVVTSGPATNNWNFGSTPLPSQIRDLKDEDRAARQFVSNYNDTIVFFEQVLETIDGRVIGDRDGKFRFFVDRNEEYPPPGAEDDIYGYLNPRFVWSEVFQAANGTFGVTQADPIVDPLTASLDPVTLVVSGKAMDPWTLDNYIKQQDTFVLNDMDDIILRGKERARLTFPPFAFVVDGEFRSMWYPSILSRLYPEATLAFTTTYPGLGADLDAGNNGVYSFAKILGSEDGPVLATTFNKDIGTIANPSLGTITGITGQTKVRERLARARVWAYSPTGFAPFTSSPAIIATPLPLGEFPIDPTTGLPDFAQLAAQGGDLIDLSTGDVEMSTPPFPVYDDAADIYPQLALGKPDGSTFQLGSVKDISAAFGVAFSGPIPEGIYVDSVLAGCIITFRDSSGSITSADEIARVGEGGLLTFETSYGDTIYVIAPNSVDASGYSDPPTFAELQKFGKNAPFLDVGIRERSGAFVDRSLPSFADPAFPIKEMVAQRTASPLQTIEADIEFANVMMKPHKFPALLGESTNDSGDFSIPYLTTTNTELDRLGQVSSTFVDLVYADNPGNTAAVYPDEIVVNDGDVLGAAVGTTPPATLLTSRDLTPVTTAGVYTPHSGIGDTQPFDLLFMEVGQSGLVGSDDGATGILSVGDVTTNTVETPRFISPTLAGTRIRYAFDNAMAHRAPVIGATGVTISEVGPNTIFNITTVPTLVLNDGSGVVAGGLNNIVDGVMFPFGANDNSITIRIYNQTTGVLLETFTYEGSGPTITGGAGFAGLATPPLFNQKTLTIPAIGFTTNLGGPFDFTLSIDTYFGGAPNAGSDTGFVATNRLTFVESFDMRSVYYRGYVNANNVSFEGRLNITRVTASGNENCTVNAMGNTNAGVPFTFLRRSSLSDVIGTFDPSPGTGLGSVKVMAFEKGGNNPLIPTAALTFSTLPSALQDENGDILTGTATCADGLGFAYPYLQLVVPATGALDNVVPGDVVVIDQSSIGDAAVKAGTHLVRHSMPTVDHAPSVHAGSTGWVDFRFPRIVSATTAPFRLVVDTLTTVPFSPTGHDFPATGRVYVIVDPADLTSVVYASYTAVATGATTTFTLTGGSARDHTGGVITNAAFVAAAGVGKQVSGMVFLPITSPVPAVASNNIVGDSPDGTEIGGLRFLTVSGVGGLQQTFDSTLGPTIVDSTGGAAPGADILGVWVSDAPGGTYTSTSTSFEPDLNTPVYENVAMFLDMRELANGASTFGTAVNGFAQLRCILPSQTFTADDGAGTAGFHALVGVFLEPSFALSALDLGQSNPLVVDAGTVLSQQQIGMRQLALFGAASPELVSFQVRRIRRFHLAADFEADLAPLRFAYEIRTGTVASYTTGSRVLTANGTGTQLGGFNDKDVNINPGDVVRIVDGSGTVLDTAEIAAVLSATSVWLRAPGFTSYVPVGGETFEVYLRQAPVPHAQSNEQLLDAITEEVLYTSTANPTTGDGGKVATVNELQDDSVADFTTLGIKVGDIVLVDPAGLLQGPTGVASPPEYGAPPVGDQSVSVRGAPSWVSGGPSLLDDNRGWYRVIAEPSTSTVQVSGASDFAGPDGSPVIYGDADQEYAVLPDITGSGLTGTTEGQNDLRVTLPADPSNSYLGNAYHSVEPFSYRIIRQSGLVSAETADLILFMRERILSWMEKMNVAYVRSGTYYVFQRDEHIDDLGSPTDPSDGLGVPSNLFITSFTGLVNVAPFANTSECLSILDRRYWCLDYRLDNEFPPYSVGGDPYSTFAVDNSPGTHLTVGSGRPVEPDRLEEVLDRTDMLREQRYSWVKFRANRFNGTLPSIDRFYVELPERLAAQVELLRLQRSITEVE
jgi:hypothetical protein